MPVSNAFEAFLKDEIEKEKGLYIPVKSGLLERLFVRKCDCSKLHPNPDDEFCYPDIGPNYKIISDYEHQFREAMNHNMPIMDEALVVCKTYPDGYIIVNGHHRWAAARRMKLNRVPIRIINMMSEDDFRRIIESSNHDKRVTMDLDEVVFRSEQDQYLEKRKVSIGKHKINKRMMLGIPAIMRYFNSHGYDIWVYASDFYSIDDVRRFFERYSVHVDGIVTGTAKKNIKFSDSQKNVMSLIKNKYEKTIHIDNNMVLYTRNGSVEFEEFEIDVPGSLWSKKVIEIIEKLEEAFAP